MKSLNLVLIICLCFLWSCSKKNIASKEVHVQIDCHILDKNFQSIKSFPGTFCAFFPNGEWVSLTGKVIDLHSKTNQLRLHFPQMGHDEIKLSKDETRIFFLSSEVKDYKGNQTRFDVINISDRDGKLLAKWDMFEHIDELTQKLDLKNLNLTIPIERQDENLPDVKFEFAHLNAIYEIPKNDLEKKYPYMKEGNLLVTFNGLGSVAIFDPALKSIEYLYRVLKPELFGINDGQILANGDLLLFKNGNQSSVNEYNMQQDIPVWSFVLKSSSTESLGAVQLLSNNNFFVTENSANIGKMLEITRFGKIVRTQRNDILDSRTKKPTKIYRAKKLNLEKFLENNF